MWHLINEQGFNVAVVGATGAVGEVLLDLLEQRSFPVKSIKLLASARSAGILRRFGNTSVKIQEATPRCFAGADIVFFAATGELSRTLAPAAVKAGAIVIDKSNTWRMTQGVPLVVPEVNSHTLAAHQGIISCPNCTTVGLVMALEPLKRAAGLKSVVVTTLQAVSGSGKDGVDELSEQTVRAVNGEPCFPSVYPKPIQGNVLPLCERFAEDGYSTEEHKLRDETRKILGLPNLAVTMTCVRVPVNVGHSASVLVETEQELSVEQAQRALQGFPGIKLYQSDYPTPLETAGQDLVLVGRVRNDLDSNRLWLWEVSDNLRKGAATNALQVAEELIQQGLVQSGIKAPQSGRVRLLA